MIVMMSFFKRSQTLKNGLNKNTAAMKCQTEELMRLEFLLSPVSPESKSHRSSTECIQISFSQCSRLSTATFKMGTPGKKPQPNKNNPNSKKNVFLRFACAALELRCSDTCLPALGCDVAFPQEVGFLTPWKSSQSILLTALTPPYN